MKTWITSDLHFGHVNIQKFCPHTRGHYKDVYHMNAEMMKIWNETVACDDTVYILGDVSFMNVDKTVSLLHSLKGNKILIKGNHDAKLLKDKRFLDCFKEIHDYYRLVYNKQYLIIMFHYPIWEWDQMHRGSIHFHGHLHGNENGMPNSRAIDVGMDATGNVVY
jgi:calcineurin-like phosphoesterase family protein